jgi:hypothetical protein
MGGVEAGEAEEEKEKGLEQTFMIKRAGRRALQGLRGKTGVLMLQPSHWPFASDDCADPGG